jgi:hypothetical protein
MAGLSTILDVVKTAIKAGTKEDSEIVALLDAAGLDSGDATVSVVRSMIDNSVTSVSTVTKDVTTTVQGAITAVGETAEGAISTAAAHPTATGIAIAAVGGIALYGGYELGQENAAATTAGGSGAKDSTTACSVTNPCTGTMVCTNGACVAADEGLLGGTISGLSEALFGTTPGQVVAGIESEIATYKWWIAGGLLAIGGIAAVAYVYKSRAAKESPSLKLTV